MSLLYKYLRNNFSVCSWLSDTLSNSFLFFSKICDGYRHSPIRTLKRRYNMLDDGPEKEQVYEVLLKYTGVDNEEQERTDTRTIIDWSM